MKILATILTKIYETGLDCHYTNCRKDTLIPPKLCCFRRCFDAEMHLQHPTVTSRPSINIGLGGRGAPTSSYSFIAPCLR